MSVRVEPTKVLQLQSGDFYWICNLCKDEGLMQPSKLLAARGLCLHKRSNKHHRNLNGR